MGNGDDGGKGWKDALPEDIRSHPSLGSLDSVESLAKSYVNAQKLIGKEKLPVPTGPEDKETWNTVFTRLGRPETAEGYQIDRATVPSEIPIDDDFLTNFRTMVHGLGLNPTQTQGIFNWWVELEKGVLGELSEMDQTERQQAEAALRQEWGKAYDQNIVLARTLITKFGGKVASDLLSSPFANDPKVIKFLAAIGRAMSEDSDLLEGIVTPTLTPAEAQAEISKIQNDPNHAYHKGGHPEHQAAVDYMESLFKLVYPEGKK